jgi:hypothetical protein
MIATFRNRSRFGTALTALAVTAGILATQSLGNARAAAAAALQQQRSDTVVLNATGPAPGTFATLQAELTIGKADGPPEYIIGQISSAAMGKDGSIYIAESGRTITNVRQYDAQGKYLRTYGRRGQGPGELGSSSDFAIHPDGRLFVFDRTKPAVVIYSATGEYLTEWQTPSVRVLQQFHFLITPEGITYVPNMYTQPGQPSTSQTVYSYIRLDANGRVIDTLVPPATPTMPERRISGTAANGTPRSITVPFTPEYVMAMSRLGYFITGRTDRYSIELHLPTMQGGRTTPWRPGNPITSIRHNVTPTPFPESERTYIRSRIDAAGTFNWGSVQLPRNRPSYIFLASAFDGRIYAMGFDQQHTYSGEELNDFDDSAPHEVAVYEPTGAYLGKVKLPAQTWLVPGYGDRALLLNFGAAFPQVTRVRFEWPARR